MAISAARAAFLGVSLLLTVTVGIADVVVVDVSKWHETGTGETDDGWQVSKLARYSDKGVRFGSKEAFALSPVYSGFVTQATVTVRSSSLSVHCYMTLTPENATGMALQAEPCERYAEQRFSWALSDGVRQLRFQNVGDGNAGWGIAELKIHLDRVDPPTELVETRLYRDAFECGWRGDSRSVRHQLEVAKVVLVPPRYDELRRWDFSILTNEVNRTRPIEELPLPEGLGDFEGENLCLQGLEGGHLQLGKNKLAGQASFDLPDKTGRTLLVEMSGHYSDTPGTIGVKCGLSDGTVKELASLYLTDTMTEFRFAVPDDATRMILQSLASRRIRVRSVMVVSGYEAGSVSTNVACVVRTKQPAAICKNLAPGEWLWRVRSYDILGLDSRWTEYRKVNLSDRSPQYHPPGCVLILR